MNLDKIEKNQIGFSFSLKFHDFNISKSYNLKTFEIFKFFEFFIINVLIS